MQKHQRYHSYDVYEFFHVLALTLLIIKRQEVALDSKNAYMKEKELRK